MAVTDIFLEQALEELEQLRKENEDLKTENERLWAFYFNVEKLNKVMREILDE